MRGRHFRYGVGSILTLRMAFLMGWCRICIVLVYAKYGEDGILLRRKGAALFKLSIKYNKHSLEVHTFLNHSR
jgi:hypothetical protein